MKTLVGIVLMAMFAVSAVAAVAQEGYPSRSITIVDPYPPGGGVDILVRALVKPLQRVLKQPLVVTYRSGAGGATGIASVANAAPDGYTLLVSATSTVTSPEADKLFGRASSYTTDQLTGLALFSAEPTVLVVHPSLRVKTAREFIELAKAHPGKLVVSSGGLYG